MAQLTANVHEMRGRTDVGHIPPMPLWIAIIHIIQAVLAIIILALTAFAAHVFQVTFSGFGMSWFVFIWTLFFLAYIFVSTAVVPTLYNMWAHLGLQTVTTFWWLVTFALLASEASVWGIVEDYTYVDSSGYVENVDYGLPANWKSAIDCAKASAGLGALEWVLFIITLVMFGLSVHKYRQANRMAGAAAASPGAPVMEEHKMEPVPVQDQHFQQQQMA